MGIWRGKKGSSVFYYLRNSNNAQKQGIRERVYEVNNPKTAAQAQQRQKLAPAQNVGNALADIIRRSWQGKDYGGLGRQEYMKNALKLTAGVPWLDKDELRPVPGAYQISSGRITEVSISSLTNSFATTSLKTTNEATTIGVLSAGLIANQPYLQSGDQITFIACVADTTSNADALTANYYWSYLSIKLDETSTENLLSLTTGFVHVEAVGDDVKIIADNGDQSIAAAAVIVSRDGDTQPMRSPSTIALNETFLAPWFTAQRRIASAQTYMDTTRSSNSADWEVDTNSASGSSVNYVRAAWTISGVTGTKAAANGQSIWVDYNADTGVIARVPVTTGEVSTANTLVRSSNNSPLYVTVEMQFVDVTKDDVPVLASLPSVNFEG